MLGSFVPVSSILLRTISMACVIVAFVICCLSKSENFIKNLLFLLSTNKFLFNPKITDLIFSLETSPLFSKEIAPLLATSFLYPILDFLREYLISDNNPSSFSSKTIFMSA